MTKEELRRLFQISDQFHADELPTKAGIKDLDKLRFEDFLHTVYQQDFPEEPGEQLQLLQNMNLATDNGELNLAGLLLFAEKPERFKPNLQLKLFAILAIASIPVLILIQKIFWVHCAKYLMKL